MLAEGPAHAPDDGRRVVTFTFDDGPFPETTPAILEILAKHRVRATFFWIGRYLDGDDTTWEQEPLRKLTAEGQLASFRHEGFWQAMDTLRDRNQLERLWGSGTAPWRVWK